MATQFRGGLGTHARIRLLVLVLLLPISPGPLVFAGRAAGDLVDLAKISPRMGKGRVQDGKDPVVEALIAAGVRAVPFLVAKLDDRTRLPVPVIDFWPQMEVRHVALFVLCALFTPRDATIPTVPGLTWDDVLERRDRDLPAWELYDTFVAKNGHAAIRVKVDKLLAPYRDKLVWDRAERCFRVVS